MSTESTPAESGEVTFYHRTLTVGDPNNCVGICTLWTPQDKIARNLAPHEYGRIGNLYSRDGINHIVRNVFAEPIVRVIIVCGVDLMGSGEAFLRLAKNGIDSEYRIVGDAGLIDRDIPRWAIDEFREKVQLIDLRGTTDADALRAVLRTIPAMAPFGPPRFFPRTEPSADFFPSEAPGLAVRGKRVADVWLRMLGAAMRFGAIQPGFGAGRQKVVHGLTAVVEQEDAENLFIPEWLTATPEYLESVALPMLLSPEPPDGMLDSEGKRLFDFDGLDQVDRLANQLRDSPRSDSAVAAVWRPDRDAGAPFAPMLIALQASVLAGKLHLTALLRATDVYRSWPETAFGLRRLQARLAEKAGGLALGSLQTVSTVATIADDAWELARDVVEQNRRRVVRRPRKDERDPRGSFVVRLENGEIWVAHYSRDGVKLQEFHGTTAAELILEIQPFLSQIDHALHIGGELAKAEIALLTPGAQFLQDHPLQFDR